MSEVALPAEDLLLTSLGIQTTPTSLTLPPDISYEDYERVGEFLGQSFWRVKRLESTINWYIGDWLIQGEMLHGDKIYQAAELTRRDPQTLANIASCVRRVPKSVRSNAENITFSHHMEVKALEPTDQGRWLKTAEEENLSTSRLREYIRAERNGTPDITDSESFCKCCGRPL